MVYLKKTRCFYDFKYLNICKLYPDDFIDEANEVNEV